jgi:hypothetical protein
MSAGAGYHTGGFVEYKINTVGTAIYNGGCVTMTAGGGIDVLTDSVSNATTTAGVLVGARWIDVNGSIKYSQYYDGVSTNTDYFAFIAPARGNIFKVQGTTDFADAQRGVPYNTSGTSGSTVTGNSDLACTNGTAGSNPPLVVIDVINDGVQSGSSTPDLVVRFATGAIQELIT